MGVEVQSEMQMFLEMLRHKVAAEEAAAATAVVTTDEEDDDADDDTQSNKEALQWLPPQVLERDVQYTNGDTYKGSMLGDKRHGHGVHKTSTGDVYEGDWRYDVRHGQGKFTMKNGTTYEGQWEDDKACGVGVCHYPDGAVYDGEWHCDCRHGWGVFTAADGQSYEGEWKEDKMHGEGHWVFSDGLGYFEGSYDSGNRQQGKMVVMDPETKKPIWTYSGSFKGTARHGHGVCVYEPLWQYEGDWCDDMRQGSGKCKYIDGSVYEGSWHADVRQGDGRLVLPDGYEYHGDWKNDLQHGSGRAKYATGERYSGRWKNGKRHGRGRWISTPVAVAAGSSSSSSSVKEGRDQYVGFWVDDVKEGEGVMVYADGGRYEGSWKCNKRHGQGLMIFSDGLAFRGYWDSDAWIQSAADPGYTRIDGLISSPAAAAAGGGGGGVSASVAAGQTATFCIQARDENNQPRLSGGDAFSVLLVPAAAAAAGVQPNLAAAAQSVTNSVTSGNKNDLVDVLKTVNVTSAAAPAAKSFTSNYSTAAKKGRRSVLISHPLLLPPGNSGGGSSSSSNPIQLLQQADSVRTQDQDQDQDDVSDQNDDQNHNSRPDQDHQLQEVVAAAAVGQVQDNGDGTYSCSYSCNIAGTYELHITTGSGEHVADSPYSITIVPGPPSARRSVVLLPAAAAAGTGYTLTAGAASEFMIEIRDAFGNCTAVDHDHHDHDHKTINKRSLQIQAQLLGSNTLPISEVKVQPVTTATAAASTTTAAAVGRYCCRFIAPTAAGLYVLEVTDTVSDRHLRGSPFSVRVVPSDEAATDHCPAATRNHSSSDSSSKQTPAAAGGNPAAAAAAAAAVTDQIKWWGDVAAAAYAAVDGCLDGFDTDESSLLNSSSSSSHDDQAGSKLSGSEADLIKNNPNLPVVERLEDLWLLSKLQQERKLEERQQQQRQGQQQDKDKQQQQQQDEDRSCKSSKGQQQQQTGEADSALQGTMQGTDCESEGRVHHGQRRAKKSRDILEGSATAAKPDTGVGDQDPKQQISIDSVTTGVASCTGLYDLD